VKEKEFVDLLEAIHRKLGLIQNSTQSGWRFNSYNMQDFMALTYETQFAQGKGSESFTFLVEGEQAKLVNYNINSKEMMLK